MLMVLVITQRGRWFLEKSGYFLFNGFGMLWLFIWDYMSTGMSSVFYLDAVIARSIFLIELSSHIDRTKPIYSSLIGN